ncbi:TPA: hypothetical protein OUL96_000212 [Clostridioides difficile]|nr:hypothetical protein [Clostridioides difficile]
MAGNLNNMRAVNNFRGDKNILECLVSFEGRSISQRKVRVFFKEKQNQIEIEFVCIMLYNIKLIRKIVR